MAHLACRNNVGCEIVATKPTVENVIPYVHYQQTQPRLKGVHLLQQNELPILYGGGRDFLFGLFHTECYKNSEAAELFILNTCIVIWLSSLNCGLQIPYQCVVYHAVKETDDPNLPEGHRLELVITVQRDDVVNHFFPNTAASELYTMSSVELVLRPKYANYDRHYNDDMEQLFIFRGFGLNRGDTMVTNCNKAIANCMDFYLIEDDDEEDEHTSTNRNTNSIQDENQVNIDENPLHIYTGLANLANDPSAFASAYANRGNADDLDDDVTISSLSNDGTDASMSLQFDTGLQIAGKKKIRSDDDDSMHYHYHTLDKRPRDR
ncbi:Lot5p Ecym_3238 [Eremothecium cymbalariae DBVPG|uniref:Protein LOT5 n=1 Tax=Eremothecium cymbalariae (strain CBS 270.75 / DBVPG 7215 / KCTC 17166 / NRRL Y-17582) TaxID=931890 RepID=G8JRG3_ERECY|nr:Hypothetical protein Ecym_3238 [Eremothecium cymbalariae DBVPG\